MTPPVFPIAVASPAVLAQLGASPTRFWPAGKAPQNEERPYAVWQIISGNPANSLSCPPREDYFLVQVDAYAKTVSAVREVAEALRDAYEASYNQISSWDGDPWEQATGLYRFSFSVEFWTRRPAS